MQLGVAYGIATLLTAVANLGLLFYLRRLADRPGLTWFQAVIACQTLFCATYGVGLFMGTSWVRVPLLVAFWLAAIWIGVCYLAFALDYTGRADYVRSWPFRAVVAVQAAASAVVVTSPFHDVGIPEVSFAPYAGVHVPEYVHSPFVVFEFLVVVALATLGVVLLIDTVVSYGPLYRKHALAIAITPIPPTLAFTGWLLEVPPLYPLNVTPLAFFPHLLLDLYALFGEDMFEFPPATQRTAERATVDDLGNPVVVADPDDRIVRLNPAAVGAFGVEQASALTTTLDSYLDPLEDGSDGEHVHVGGDRSGRVYARTRNELVDGTGTVVGYTDVFQDVTAERRREQRVGVLNRVLRHNLRNDLTVVLGNVEAALDATDDEFVAARLRTAVDETQSLAALGERARDVDATMSGAIAATEGVEPGVVLDAVVEYLRATYPDATIDVSIPESVVIATDPDVFRVVFENLVENALAHADAPEPTVQVTLAESPTESTNERVDDISTSNPDRETVAFAVTDDGPGIPEHELSVLDAAEESSLQHGSGLGLWVVNWGVTALGGDLAFEEPSDGGTRVVVTLPVD